MSRCEHGEMISIFCLNESCTWRESGGCETCFKRYHSHPSNIGTITQQKLQELYRKVIVRPDPKVKSRILQEAIYNYFLIMKSQISASIDAVSKLITSTLNNPYLTKQKQLETFNKIKNKQYKKINKKELKSFCNFANERSKQQLDENEKILYLEEVTKLMDRIYKVNESFQIYSKAVKDLDNSFIIDEGFINKIQEVVKTIPSLIKQQKYYYNRSQDEKSKSRDSKKAIQVTNNKQSKRNDRDRKVSLDITNAVKFTNNLMKQNQQKKKKNVQIENTNVKNKIDQIKVDFGSETSTLKSSKNDVLTQQAKRNQEVVQKNIDRERAISVDRGFLRPKYKNYKEEEIQENTRSINSRIMEDEKIPHTTLPRETSKPKLYQNTKDVKQKKITVAVRIDQQNGQSSSPILKKKKTIVQHKGLNLFKVQSLEEEQSPEVKKKQMSNFDYKSNQKGEQTSLKEKQTESLALLISSLSASAQKAIPLLQAAIKYSHNNLSAAEYLSYLYLQIGKPKQCLVLCNQFLQQIEDSSEKQELALHLNNNKAAALNMLGRYSQSISILEKCIQQSEKDIYFKNLGDAYFSIGIFEKAVYNYERAIKLNSDLDEALFNLAVCMFMQKNYVQSNHYVNKALRIQPKNQAYLQLSSQLSLKINPVI